MSGLRQIPEFLKDVRTETARVQWPASKQTVVTTGAVVVFAAITAAYLAGLDMVISRLVGLVVK